VTKVTKEARGLRDEEMARLFRAGWTQQKIAKAFGVSEPTVRTVLKRFGLRRADGGKAVSISLKWPVLASADEDA
jgi:transposase